MTPRSAKTKARLKRRREEIQPTAGSYFTSVSVENFRCFSEKQTLSLSNPDGRYAPWTILLGENGCGKTTVLQAIASLEFLPETGPDAEIRRKSIESLGPEASEVVKQALLLNPRGAVYHVGDLINLNAVSAQSRESALSIEGMLQTIDDVHSHSSAARKWLSSVGFNRGVFKWSNTSDSNNPQPRMHAYGAGRRLGIASFAEPAVPEAAQSLFDEHAQLIDAEEWLLQLDYSATKLRDGRQREFREMIVNILINVLPEVAGIRFDASSGTHPKPKVEFKTPYGWVALRQLGYGYRTMIAWIVDLASRMIERTPHSIDPLAEPSVVLVDEIDLHLHPTWQRKLIRFLSEKFPNTQFIASAHSPLIVQAAIDANFALLRRVGDHVVIDNDVEPLRGATVEQILTSDLFGLRSLRPPNLDLLLDRRRTLLTKPRLTPKDKRELAQLEAELGVLPVGETNDQAKRMMQLIEESQRLLREHKGGTK